MFKVDRGGWADEVRLENLQHNTGLQLKGWEHGLFQQVRFGAVLMGGRQACRHGALLSLVSPPLSGPLLCATPRVGRPW